MRAWMGRMSALAAVVMMAALPFASPAGLQMAAKAMGASSWGWIQMGVLEPAAVVHS